MAIKVKPGVTFVYHPALFRILETLKKISGDIGRDLVITSGSDGEHSGPNDPHYSGQALDIRTNDLKDEVKQLVLKLLLQDLGPKFSGFIENPGKPAEHLHVQRTFGTIYTINDYLVD